MKLIIRPVKTNNLRRNHLFIHLWLEVLKQFATVRPQVKPYRFNMVSLIRIIAEFQSCVLAHKHHTCI